MNFLNKNLIKTVLKVSLIAAPTAHAQAFWEFLEPTKLTDAAENQIAKQKISASVNVFDVNVAGGINLAAKYKAESEPSYLNGYYSRSDQYSFDAGVNVGDIISGLGPFGFNIERDASITFVRQFKTQTESVTAIPYFLDKFPTDSQRAISRLKVGDFVAFKSKLNLIAGVSDTQSIATGIDFSAYSNVFVSGEFNVQIFKISESKLRVKLFADKGRGSGAGFSIGVSPTIHVFGMKIVNQVIDKVAKKIINFEPLSVSLTGTVDDVFMFDYIFDLNSKEAAKAYDDLMQSRMRFRPTEISTMWRTRQEIMESTLVDLTDIEAISLKDKNQSNKRIERVFKGSNQIDTQSSNLSISLSVLTFQQGESIVQNKILSYDASEKQSHYLLDTLSTNSSGDFLFGLYGGGEVINANVLFAASSNWTPLTFEALIASREYKFRNFKESDYLNIQQHMQQVLPAEMYHQINWQKWNFSYGSLANGYFKNEVIINPEITKYVYVGNNIETSQIFTDYISKIFEKTGAPTCSIASKPASNDKEIAKMDWINKYSVDIYNIGVNYAVAFNKKYSNTQRYHAFLALKDIPLWREYGIGFLLNQVPSRYITSVAQFKMHLSASKEKPIEFTSGTFAREKIYKQVIFLQNTINNTSYNPNPYTEAN